MKLMDSLATTNPDSRAALKSQMLAFGPDAGTTVSLLVALEEAAEAELGSAILGSAGRTAGHHG